MSIAPSVNASVTQEVKLTPSQKRRLLTELKVLEELRAQRKAIEQAESVHKDKIGELREQIGAEKIELLEGYRIAYVQGVRSVLSKEALLRAGVSMAVIEQSTEHKPVKSYVKISFPGDAKERD